MSKPTAHQAGAASGNSVLGISHIGLCVSDFEKSLRFYTEGLGFCLAEGWDIPSRMAPLAEVDPPMQCRSQMIVLGHTKIELLGWKTPSAGGAALSRRNQIGFTHLSVHVDDLAAVEERLLVLGGTALEHTRLCIPMPGGALDVVFVADPDGVRVELAQEITG